MKKIVLIIALVALSATSFAQTRIKANQIGGGSNGQILQSDGTKGGWVTAPYIQWSDTTNDGEKQIVTLYQLKNTMDTSTQYIRVESDPTVPSNVKSITTTDQSNWDAAYNDHITSASFASGTGILTLTQQDNGTVSVNIDGRYLTITDANNDYVKKSTSVTLGDGLNGSSNLSSGLNVNMDFSYLDGRYLSGFKQKEPVAAATGSNITLSGLQTIDGVSLSANDRVLVKGQTNAADNGIYVVSSGTWTRSTDFDEAKVGEIEQGASVYVQGGTNNGNTSWTLSTGGTIVVGTTDLDFIQSAGSTQYQAGNDLNLDGTTFSLNTGLNDLENYYTKTQSDAKYLESFSETDPVWTSAKSAATNISGNWTMNNITINGFLSDGTPGITIGSGGTYNNYIGTIQGGNGFVISTNATNLDGDIWHLEYGNSGNPRNASALLLTRQGDLTVNTSAMNAADAAFSSFFSQTKYVAFRGDNISSFNNDAGYITSADPVTLGTNKNGLSLSGQELQLALATTSSAGAMSAADKSKLNGIETGAEVNDPTNLSGSLSGNSLTITSSTGSDATVDLSGISTDVGAWLTNNITATQETVSGTGTNSISIAHTPVGWVSPVVSVNGVVQKLTTDYTISGTTITFTFSIATTDVVIINYSY